ncbi:pro-resilin-like [Pollicipes pollicipes]|uniref:pro-resilin-like n=1 Tax=Pollicipes pollicipes TaxID=41117 RepID=UPI0018851FAF|nr:pro-resilin-like [Pollicipes pollicipes]
MRCFLSICTLLATAASAPTPQGDSYGAPSPLDAVDAAGPGPLGPLGGRGRLGLGRPSYGGRLGGLLGSPLGGPLGGQRGAFIGNLGNPPQLRPDGLLDGPGVPYSFSWTVDEPDYGNNYGHSEESDGIVTQGEYRVLLPDSRTQIVTYVVEGDSGYQAQVTLTYPSVDTVHLGSPLPEVAGDAPVTPSSSYGY